MSHNDNDDSRIDQLAEQFRQSDNKSSFLSEVWNSQPELFPELFPELVARLRDEDLVTEEIVTDFFEIEIDGLDSRNEKEGFLARVKELFPDFAKSLDDHFQIGNSMLKDDDWFYPANRPKKIDQFEIKGVIGIGGMGIVLLAWDTKLIRHVAIKTTRESRNSSIEFTRYKNQFQKEYQTLARIKHRNVIPIFEIGEYDNRPYIVMPNIEGATLDTVTQAYKELGSSAFLKDSDPKEGIVIPGDQDTGEERKQDFGDQLTGDRITEPQKESALSPSQKELRKDQRWFTSVASSLRQVANSIQVCHDSRVVHCDLKPSNILIEKDGQTWIIDFGLAQTLQEGVNELNGVGGGSIPFMAPEQFDERVTTATDIWGIGAILYELLTFNRIYANDEQYHANRKPEEVEPYHKSLRQNPPASLRSLNPAIPADLAAIGDKCLRTDPKDRYTTARELTDDLDNWLNDRPVNARKQPLAEVIHKWIKRNPVWTSVIAGSLLVAIISVWATVSTLNMNSRITKQANTIKKNAEKIKNQNTELDLALNEVKAERDRADEENKIATSVRDFLLKRLILQGVIRAREETLVRSGEFTDHKTRASAIRDFLDIAKAELTPEKIEIHFPNMVEIQVELLSGIGSAFNEVGEHQKAIGLLKNCIRLANNNPEKIKYHDVLATKDTLGTAFFNIREFSSAVKLFEEVSSARMLQRPIAISETVDAFNNLGMALRGLNRTDEAIEAFKKAMQQAEKLPENHDARLITLAGLGAAYKAKGTIEKAIPLLEASSNAIIIQNYEHQFSKAILNILAEAYEKTEQWDKAERLLKDWLAAIEKSSGTESGFYGMHLLRIGFFHERRGDLTQAENSLRKSLELGKQHRPNDFFTFHTMSELAKILISQEKYDDAEVLLLTGFEGLEKLKDTIPNSFRPTLTNTIKRLVSVYRLKNDEENVKKWRDKHAELAADFKK